MSPVKFLSTPSAPPAVRFDPSSRPRAIWNLEQRLARAEDELRIQFSRIAQLQAELDRVLATLQRLTSSAKPR
jgi:hypothetical protein